MDIASTVLLGVISSLVSASLFLLILSRMRPRIEICEHVSHLVVPGRALDRFAVKIRNRTRAQLLDVRIKASFILHYDAKHSRVGRGTQLQFEYPTLFDLAKREPDRSVSGRSTFEFAFRTPLQPLMALSDDWAIRVAVTATHSLSGLGGISKRDLVGEAVVKVGAFEHGSSLRVIEGGAHGGASWKPLGGPVLDRHLVSELLARVSAVGHELVKRERSQLVAMQKGDEFDIVTDADMAAEVALGDILRELFPDDGIVSEEMLRVDSHSGAWWLLDPIDGTVNYMNGDRCWGISLARRLNDVIVMSLVLFPELQQTFFAVRGQGAFCNGERLAVGSRSDLNLSVVATRFGMSKEDRVREYEVLGKLLDTARDIRRTGCTSLDIAQVAAGVVDAYVGRGLGLWDAAPGALLIEEAGGQWGDWSGEPRLETASFLGGNSTLFRQLVDMVQESGGVDWRPSGVGRYRGATRPTTT